MPKNYFGKKLNLFIPQNYPRKLLFLKITIPLRKICPNYSLQNNYPKATIFQTYFSKQLPKIMFQNNFQKLFPKITAKNRSSKLYFKIIPKIVFHSKLFFKIAV